MDTEFEKTIFSGRLKSMLKVDFKRMFTMPLVYITAGVSFALPVLILVMTSLMGAPEEGAEAAQTFTNVWQAIGAVSSSDAGSSLSMDITTMCNINMLYFLVSVFVCIFVGEDFKSGYAKNLFTVRAKKTDYVISKSIVTFVGATAMFIAYFIGAMIGGAIAGLPFGMQGFNAANLIACLFSKIFVTAIFVGISLTLSVVAKQRLWLSIIISLAAGMLLYMMIPMMTPLNSGFLNVIMTLAGGGLFAAGLGAVSNIILNKTCLV